MKDSFLSSCTHKKFVADFSFWPSNDGVSLFQEIRVHCYFFFVFFVVSHSKKFHNNWLVCLCLSFSCVFNVFPSLLYLSTIESCTLQIINFNILKVRNQENSAIFPKLRVQRRYCLKHLQKWNNKMELSSLLNVLQYLLCKLYLRWTEPPRAVGVQKLAVRFLRLQVGPLLKERLLVGRYE